MRWTRWFSAPALALLLLGSGAAPAGEKKPAKDAASFGVLSMPSPEAAPGASMRIFGFPAPLSSSTARASSAPIGASIFGAAVGLAEDDERVAAVADDILGIAAQPAAEA